MRYRAGNGRYVSLSLIPKAVPSHFDLPYGEVRRLLSAAARELAPEGEPEEELVR